MAARQVFRFEAERLKLPTPFSRRIAEPLDASAAGQATFYGCLNKIECEEGERDGHIGLPNVTFFASARLSDHGYPKNHTQVPRLHNCSIKAKSGQDDLFRAQRKAR